MLVRCRSASRYGCMDGIVGCRYDRYEILESRTFLSLWRDDRRCDRNLDLLRRCRLGRLLTYFSFVRKKSRQKKAIKRESSKNHYKSFCVWGRAPKRVLQRRFFLMAIAHRAIAFSFAPPFCKEKAAKDLWYLKNCFVSLVKNTGGTHGRIGISHHA